MNSSDTFPRRKFEKWPPRSCRLGRILSISTVRFELHAKVAEEIYVEMYIHGQLSEVQMIRDLDLDLDWVKVTSTYTVHVGLPAGPTT